MKKLTSKEKEILHNAPLNAEYAIYVNGFDFANYANLCDGVFEGVFEDHLFVCVGDRSIDSVINLHELMARA